MPTSDNAALSDVPSGAALRETKRPTGPSRKGEPEAGRAGIKQLTWLPPQDAEARRQFGGLKPEEADSYRCLFIKSLQMGVNSLKNKLLLSGWQFLNFIHSTL